MRYFPFEVVKSLKMAMKEYNRIDREAEVSPLTDKKRHTTVSLKSLFHKGEKIVMVTAYDAAQSSIAEKADADVILVGDSLGMVVLGYDNTIPVTLEDMIHHAKAVRRGAPNTMMMVDMPFLSYHKSIEDTLTNAGKIMQAAYADGVKLEGGADIAEHVKALVRAGIPVCGHLGLTPQNALNLGGFRVQGKDAETAEKILRDAISLVEAGVFMLVLECVPATLANVLSEQLPVPIIGIGAGSGCAGQVLVFHDLLGIYGRKAPKFVKAYAELGSVAVDALSHYRNEVKEGVFPSPAYSYEVGDHDFVQLYAKIKGETNH